MLGDSRAYDFPAIVRQNDDHVQQPKRCGRHNEHVDGGDAFGVIVQESTPVLKRCSPPSHHVLRDGHIACCGFSKLNPRGFIGGFDRLRTPRPGCPG